MHLYIKILFFIALIPIAIFAQNPDPTIAGKSITIQSKVLDQQRTIYIYEPRSQSVNEPSQVLYLLDAERNFLFAAGMLNFLEDRGICPPIILVGIPNAPGQRETDLIPGVGADKFLSFLKKELIPQIDKSYRTAPYRIISGHSSGGIFATYALLESPDTFGAAISSSPVFQTRRMSDLYKLFEEKFAKQKSWNNFFFRSVGKLETPGFFIKQNDDLSKFLTTKAPKGFNWKYKKIDDGDHNFVALPSLYYGLLELYSDWRIRLSYQVPFDIEKLKKWSKKMEAKFGYKMRIPASILIQRAMMLYFDQRYKESLPYFKFATEMHPEDPDVHFWLARNYRSLNRWKESIDSITKAIKLAKAADRNTTQFERFLNDLKSGNN